MILANPTPSPFFHPNTFSPNSLFTQPIFLPDPIQLSPSCVNGGKPINRLTIPAPMKSLENVWSSKRRKFHETHLLPGGYDLEQSFPWFQPIFLCVSPTRFVLVCPCSHKMNTRHQARSLVLSGASTSPPSRWDLMNFGHQIRIFPLVLDKIWKLKSKLGWAWNSIFPTLFPLSFNLIFLPNILLLPHF